MAVSSPQCWTPDAWKISSVCLSFAGALQEEIVPAPVTLRRPRRSLLQAPPKVAAPQGAASNAAKSRKKKLKDPDKAKRHEMEMKLLAKETAKQIKHVNEVSQEKIHAINNMLSCIRGENPPGGCESFVIAGGEEGKAKFAKVKAADAERAA